MSQARIGRIRMKAGGAEVRLMPRRESHDGLHEAIIEHARIIASTPDAELMGFMVIGFFEDGTVSVGYKHDPDRCRVPRRAWPAFCAEVAREACVTQPSANDQAVKVFNDEWRPVK